MEIGRQLARWATGLILALGIACAGVASGVPAPGPLVLRVEAPPALERHAAAVRAAGAGELDSLLGLVGLPGPGPPIRVVLAPERSALAARVASWVSGYAVPELDTIVLFPGRVASYPDRNLESLLRHEITHILLARSAGGHPLPRWFDEGTATVAAREWGIEDGARVALATIGRGPRSLTEVDASFSADGTAATRAYAMSAALVRSLLRRQGEDAVGRILARVATGAGFDDAFERATGESVQVFARNYFRREAVWTTWVPFITSSTVLWLGITALALLAIKRRRERDEAQREAWAEEERRRAATSRVPPPENGPSNWN